VTADDASLANLPRRLPWLLVAGGAVGLLASFVLLVEKIALLKDPSYVPSCSINPILSCGSVMVTDQAEAFGFPNPIIGVASFSALLAVGAALLAGARLVPWFRVGLQLGATFGVVFVHWLAFQSIYRIDALCPYCMVVWAVTIPLFWYITLANLGAARPASRLTRALTEYHGVALTVWFLAIVGAIGERFWDYWSTLL
jgi:uncharacterized membrane protein